MTYLIGLDVGTTGAKAVAFTADGTRHALAQQSYTIHHPHPGWSENDPHEILAAVDHVLGSVAAGLHGRIAAIGISSQGTAVVPVRAGGETLGNFIATMDTRVTAEYEWWRERLTDAELWGRTGLPHSQLYTIHKVMWQLKNQEGSAVRPVAFRCVQDFVCQYLTGHAAMDRSIAGRTMMLNIRTNDWDDWILAEAGLEPSLFSPVLASTTVVGDLRRSLADRLGMEAQPLIVVGGHDQACGALGAGAITTGIAANTLGTVDAMVLTAEALPPDPSDASCTPHVVEGAFERMAVNTSGGITLQWLAELLGFGEVSVLVERMADEPSRMFVLPHLGGASLPAADPYSLGAIVGIRHGATDLETGRAALDSLAYEMRIAIDSICRDTPLREIRTTGGGSASNRWLAIRADVLGVPVRRLQEPQAAALGAAMLAGIGIGQFGSATEAVEAMVRPADVVEVSPQRAAEYEALFAIYRGLYPALRQLNRQIMDSQ